jgi:hypothetical protein
MKLFFLAIFACLSFHLTLCLPLYQNFPEFPAEIVKNHNGAKVGLLAMGVYWKGLFRDAEIMAWGMFQFYVNSPLHGCLSTCIERKIMLRFSKQQLVFAMMTR